MISPVNRYVNPGLVIANEWHQELPELDSETVECIATLFRVTDLARAENAQIVKRYGLNLTEYRVLAALARSGGQHKMRMTDLFTSMLVTSSGMTKVITRLTRMGLIRCSTSAQDKRVRIASLTAKGLRMARTLVKAAYGENALIAAISSTNRADRRTLRRILSALEDVYRQDTT